MSYFNYIRFLLITIFLIVCAAVIFIFMSGPSAQNHDGVIGEQIQVFPRMFQKNMKCSQNTFVYVRSLIVDFLTFGKPKT